MGHLNGIYEVPCICSEAYVVESQRALIRACMKGLTDKLTTVRKKLIPWILLVERYRLAKLLAM